jgi:hypothetical protein
MSILASTYAPNEPGARTLAEARPMRIDGKRVTAEVLPDGTATVFVGGTIVYLGEMPEAVTGHAAIHDWIVSTAKAASAPRIITIHKTTYATWDEWEDEPEEIDTETFILDVNGLREDFGDWNDDETVWIPAAVVEVASRLLTGEQCKFWASECSSSGAEVRSGDNPFYMDEPYTHPYTGVREDKTAHLSGFTAAEIAEIHSIVIGR